MAKAWRLRETEYFSEEELAEMLGGAFPALEKFLPDPAVIISTPSSQLRLYKREDIARFSIDLLNLLRRERFFTFKELSQELQVSVPAILRWKNGSRSPRRRNIQKILAFVSSILNHGHN